MNGARGEMPAPYPDTSHVAHYNVGPAQETPMSSLLDVTDSTWDTDVLGSDIPVFVDFWAPWCGPCKAMLPYVEKLAEEYDGKVKVVKLNTQDNQEIAAKYGIVSIPTFMLIKNGEVQEQVLGSQPLASLKAKIDPHL